jgi:hypothetical protein
MQLTKDDIRDYQSIYQKCFWVEISEREAYEQWIKLIILLQNIYKPIPKD